MEQIETASFIQPADLPSDPRTIRVVSWNINRGLQFEGVVEFLRKMAADLILLQEADVNARRTHHRNIARDLAQALHMEYVFGCEFEELTQGNHNSPAYHGQATLSRIPITTSRILKFRRQSGFWRPRWFVPKIQPLQRRLGARMALVSQIPCFRKTMLIYNVHLESRGDKALRCAQLAEILNDAPQSSADTPLVIGGDFNFDLSREPAATVIAAPDNRENDVSAGTNGAFRNPFNNGNPRPTTVRSRLGRARTIDWILIRGRLACAEPELHDSVHASDHYPLSITLHAPR